MSAPDSPMVSVMMPAYNAAATLGRALASLEAQTHPNWECILVDDGSRDDPRAIVDTLDDTRIRYFRFEQNRGRGVARQFALEQSRGDFLAFLDADDWMHPAKLERQLAIFAEHPDIAMVSTAFALVDPHGDYLGTTRDGVAPGCFDTGVMQPLKRPRMRMVSIMMRMPVARAGRYNPRFARAQDLDFLMQVGPGRRWAILGEPLYVYTGWATPSLQKYTASLRFDARVYWSHRHEGMVRAARLSLWMLAKIVVYHLAFALRLENVIVGRRSQLDTSEDRAREFLRARAVVDEHLARHGLAEAPGARPRCRWT